MDAEKGIFSRSLTGGFARISYRTWRDISTRASFSWFEFVDDTIGNTRDREKRYSVNGSGK